MSKYVIGVDFGTLSARALVVNVDTGAELRSAMMDYPHAVMDKQLPDGTKLPPDWALQHPQDYMDCLAHVIPEAIRLSDISADDVIGIGIDFTACTMLPVDRHMEPLCFDPKYAGNPHAYIKLWKHHAAQQEANHITAIAKQRNEPFLPRYGGKISSEWMIPKLYQLLKEDPSLYESTHLFVESADWVIHQLTGTLARNACSAGYKALWNKQDGYPTEDFFRAIDPKFANVVDDKLNGALHPMGAKAGEITEAAARLTGLKQGIAVAVANVDAHVSFPPSGLTQSGDMLMIMGTSTCHVMVADEERMVPGMCGVVEDGVIPGLMGYEAGQSCVGDLFNWFVECCVPESYAKEARDHGESLHQLLTRKAQLLTPGESGLLALDWWNGNRSVLVDVDLTGLLLGMTLQTKPEEMYRALLEATAFGTRVIFDAFEDSGLPIRRLHACGGISQKNPLVMQIYADVLGREIRIARSSQTPALGSSIWAAVAAGHYDNVHDAADQMAGLLDTVYRPIPAHAEVYQSLYQEYLLLHDYFGRGENNVMKRLKRIKEQSISSAHIDQHEGGAR
ncbi:ribulokinase [Eubacteriales bacterium OttesenSCG-928-N13]|nr:ribulokinase [Eubacteriales bacterium OttesenSCG-928-N13]